MAILVEGNNILNVQLMPILSSLSGIVTDSSNGLPLSGVLVEIDGLATITNINGQYSFVNLTPGTYQVTFSKTGYNTVVM